MEVIEIGRQRKNVYRQFLPGRWVIGLMLVVLNISDALAGGQVFRHLTVEDGLPQMSVIDIARDPRGFLWFATADGLARFDGYEFLTFYHNPEIPDSLPNNTINSMAVDNEGLLWVGTVDGLAVIDTATLQYLPSPINNSNQVIQVLINDNDTWVAQQSTLFQIRNGAVNNAFVPPAKLNTRHSLIATGDELLVKDSAQRVWRLAPKSGFTISQLPVLAESSGIHRGAGKLLFFADGAFWAADLQDLSQRKQLIWPPGIPQHYMHLVAFIHQTLAGELWVGIHGHGVLVFDQQLQLTAHIQANSAEPSSLTNGEVKSVFEDENAIWLGNLGGGVNIYWKRENRFRQLSGTSQPNLSEPFIRGLGEFQQSLLVATNSQLLMFQNDAHSYIPEAEFRASGHCDYVKTFPVSYVNGRGELWLGADNQADKDCTVFKLDADSHTLISQSGLLPPIRDKVTAMFEDSDHTLWLASLSGFYRIDPNGGSEKADWVYKTAGIKPETIVWQIAADRNGQLWLATHESGILLVDPYRQTVHRYFASDSQPEGLRSDQVKSILHSRQGTTWVGTNLGLYRFDNQRQTFNGYTVKDGLPNEHIYGMLEDEQGYIWMSTNNGISRFDPAVGEFWNLSTSDGLQGREFNTGAFLQRHNGHLVFGGINGLTEFDPAAITPQQNFRDVRISKLKLLDESQEQSLTAPADNSLHLAYDHVQLAISVSNLDYINQREVAYRYQLLPLSKQWVNVAPGENTLYFSQLPGGHFELNIQSRNHDQQWGAEQRLLSIRVSPAPWATWWAYCIYAAVTLSLLTLGYQWRLRNIRQRQHQLEALVDERTSQLSKQSTMLDEKNQLLSHTLDEKDRIFADITHEFKTPLTLILNPVKDLLNQGAASQTDALTIVQRNALRLNHLVNQLIGFNDMTQPAGEEYSCELRQVIANVAGDFSKMAASRGMKISWQCPQVTVALSVPAVELVLGNLLSNAVKYGSANSTIELCATVAKGDYCTLSVFNEGVPVPADANLFERFYRLPEHRTRITGSGLGLSLVRQTLENYHAAIRFEPSDKGNTFILTLPVCASHQPLQANQAESAKAYESALALMAADKILRFEENEKATAHQLVIVEDDPDMSWILADKLAGHFAIHQAETGHSGIELITDTVPDLVILDFMLPDITGYQVLQAIRSNELTCHIPVLMLTAKHDRDTRLRSKAALVDAFLTKPFDDEELLLTLLNLLQIRQLIGQQTNTVLTTQTSEPEFDTPSDQQFYTRLNAVLAKYAGDTDFGLPQLAEQLFISERQLQRKCKSVFNLSPNAYIRNYRLQKARQLLEKGARVSEVVDQCGFASHSYFSQCFKALFNVTPSEFTEQRQIH